MSAETERSAKRSASQKAWREQNKAVLSERERQRHADDPGKQKDAWQRWYAKCGDERKAKLRAQRAENPAQVRAAVRRYRGIADATRPIPSACEFCGGRPGQRGLYFDHCHETNRFRGWLCHACNLGIGMLGDDLAVVMSRLAAYKELVG